MTQQIARMPDAIDTHPDSTLHISKCIDDFRASWRHFTDPTRHDRA